MTERKHDAIYTAAEAANKQFGQWMPTQWIELFIKALPCAAVLAVCLDEAAIRKDEREKCAKVADAHETTSHFGIVAKRAIAGKIRNGGKQP